MPSMPTSETAKLIEAAEFAAGAILDAISMEDGLDGNAGASVLLMLRDALAGVGKPLFNGKWPPVEDMPTPYARIQDLLHQEATPETGQIVELRRQLAIVNLSVPLEEDLAGEIEEMLKYLAMEQGYTLNGIARLLVECQRRMAADWVEIGRLRREVKAHPPTTDAQGKE